MQNPQSEPDKDWTEGVREIDPDEAHLITVDEFQALIDSSAQERRIDAVNAAAAALATTTESRSGDSTSYPGSVADIVELADWIFVGMMKVTLPGFD